MPSNIKPPACLYLGACIQSCRMFSWGQERFYCRSESSLADLRNLGAKATNKPVYPEQHVSDVANTKIMQHMLSTAGPLNTPHHISITKPARLFVNPAPPADPLGATHQFRFQALQGPHSKFCNDLSNKPRTPWSRLHALSYTKLLLDFRRALERRGHGQLSGHM